MSLEARLAAFAQRVAQQFNNLPSGGAPSLIANTGRFYLYTDFRWVTDSDDNYGPGYYQFAESGGTGADPVLEWEWSGFQVPAGRTVKSFCLTARANNTQVTDVEIGLYARRPTDPAARSSGFDADGEMTNDELWRGFWTQTIPNYSGAINDRHSMIIPLNYTQPEPYELTVAVKPQGALSANRYFLVSYVWEIE